MAFNVEIVNIEDNANNMILVSGLTIEIVKLKYNWLLNATVKNCIIGEDDYGLVWYSGEWVCGEWIDGTWYSGTWDDGTWKNGKWYSYLLDRAKIVTGLFVILDKYHTYSVFKNGFWENGDFYDGTFGTNRDISSGVTYYDIINRDFPCSYWINGRFHNGVFENSLWINGIFYAGDMSNSYWVDGKFYSGTFNHHQWFNGIWYGGDFVEGNWVNGSFNQIDTNIKSRFGTANLYNSRTIWNDGTFYNGEFHSGLNIDASGNTLPSVNNKITHWLHGNFRGGKWYGGHFYNGDFYIGNWYGGIFNTSTGVTSSNSCTWHDGNWYNGLWINGVFLDGHFYDGMWLDGIFTGGYISTNVVEGSLLPQSSVANPVSPTVVTYSATGITSTSAILNGRVTNNGGATILDRGVCWSSSNLIPTTGDTNMSDGGSMGNINIPINGLGYDTQYYYRAWAKNVTGTTYGEFVVPFKTLISSNSPPSVETKPALNPTSSSFNGIIWITSGEPIDEYGIVWTTGTTEQTPMSGLTISPPYQGQISGSPGSLGLFNILGGPLVSGMSYWYRSYATNSFGIGYGASMPFTTPTITPTLPTVTTDSIGAIADTSAITYGTVVDNGNDPITAVGACWSTSANPTTGDAHTTESGGITGPFTTTISPLLPITTYHVRAYATNSIGTSYGDDITFTTTALRSPPSVIIIKCTPS